MAALAEYTGSDEAAWEWHDLWELQRRWRGAEHFIGLQDMLWHPRRAGRTAQPSVPVLW